MGDPTPTSIETEEDAMRKLIVTNIVSLDGYFEGPGKDIMALPMDMSFDTHNAERLREADTELLGRTTYEGFKGFWPGVADDPRASADQLGVPVELLDTPIHRDISRLQNAIDKVVVSDSLSREETDPWRDTTRIVRRADAHEQIAELKRGPGRDILVFGSRTLWNDLLAAGLVDELHLIIAPVVLGDGTPAFGSPPEGPFRLLDAQTWEGSDNMLVRYAAGETG
jgi:dihydrofolate reductase